MRDLDAYQRAILHRSLNMLTLIGLGVAVAYLYSLAATLVPAIFPPSFRGPGAEVAVPFEAAAVIVTHVLLGHVLELRARSRTGAAIRALLGLAPKTARRIGEHGREEDVPLDAVCVGDARRVGVHELGVGAASTTAVRTRGASRSRGATPFVLDAGALTAESAASSILMRPAERTCKNGGISNE